MELIERDAELAGLRERLHALAGDGTGGVVLIEGPAGIGKSALLDAALRDADGLQVLRARGAELEGGLSFGAVRELFGTAVMRVKKAEREELFDGPAGLARPVLGFRGGDDGPSGDPLYGLFWLAAGLADRTPLVLVIDDLHWLDEESARFAAYLAQRLEGLPILLLAGARPAEPGTDPGPMRALAAAGAVIRPQPLTPGGLARLLPDRSAEDVHRVTGGNPLLAIEVGRALEAGGHVDAVAPRSVGRSVLERVARVSEDAVALSRAIALSAEPLTLADAAALAGLDEHAAAGAAGALVRAQVLSEDGGRLSFLHPVMRSAVYEELDPFERRGAHVRAARLLAAQGADVEAVAAHLLAGEPQGDVEAVRILRAAADRALRRAAPRAAVRYLQRALDEPPPPGEARVAMRFELGRLQASLGRMQAIATLRAALDEATVPELRADISIALAESYIEAERLQETILLLDHVRSTIELDRERRLLVDVLQFLAAVDRGDAIHELEPRADRIPEGLPGTTHAERRALAVKAYMLYVSGAPVLRVQELLDRATSDEDARLRPGTAQWHMRMMSVCGRPDVAEGLARNLLDHARAAGAESVYAAAQLQLAITANQLGDLRGAEAALRLGLTSPGATPQYRVALEDWLVTTLSMQGRSAEAEQLLESMGGRDPNFATSLLDRRRMELALDRGDYAAAVEPAERSYRLFDGRISPAAGIAADYALALAGVGRLEEAERVARAMVAAADEAGAPQARGMAHHALGVALRGDEAVAQLERAVEVLRATPFRWNLANAEVALGGALRRAGRRVDARPHLTSALDYAVRNAALPIEERAREELRLAGARPRRAVRTGVDALTPSEDRIARLAAEGMTNREIAQHLFLTIKTVETHLGNAYRKLDVSSRRELPDVYGMETRSATVLFTDIEGSTPLVERLGDQGWLELLRVHNGLMREQIKLHGGREVKTMGDGFMVVFSDATAAVRCAVDAQRALERHTLRDPERPLRLRMGLHTGEVLFDEGDYFGIAVVTASRVSARASGGEILASSTVCELVGDSFAFGAGRAIELKGVAGPVQIHAVQWRAG